MIDNYNVVSARVNQRVVERVSKYKQVIQFKRVADMLLKPIIPKVPQIIITCNNCRVTDKRCVIRIWIPNCFSRLDVHANERLFPETYMKNVRRQKQDINKLHLVKLE